MRSPGVQRRRFRTNLTEVEGQSRVSFTAAALEALLCSTHLWTTNCASHTGTKETKELGTGGEAQCSCGAEPTQRGPRGGRGRARDTRPRGPSGLRGSCPAAGAVPQRSEGGVFFVFVSLCVGGRGCNGRGPKTTPVRGNGRYHKACRGLREGSSALPPPAATSRHVLPLKR